jgi:hypothetical protein
VSRLTAMPTPPMLRAGETTPGGRSAPDPLVSVTVAAMALVAVGLLLAGILAVYDWKTPGAEAPLVFWIGVVAVTTVVINVLVVSVRFLRRLRLGL